MSADMPASAGLLKQGRTVVVCFVFGFLTTLVQAGYLVDVTWSGARIILAPPVRVSAPDR